ncbi:unnamed protein product, partial [Mesorhabditis belari]|uniref:Synapsin n=1 Tax=Mesorhabditis belari TaxID=2138241 RepID=A0AAF3FJG7_9BILA
MNFFKRKFSFHEDEGFEARLEDPSPSQPPSAFSFQAIADKVSSTISAPTSPARTQESLAAAVERSLMGDTRANLARIPPDALVILVIDGHLVDWSKYFRNQSDYIIRVEQADFQDIDIQCTEHTALVELRSIGSHTKSFCPCAVFVGPSASNPLSSSSQRIIRSLLAARIPFLNSNRSILAFMDKTNLKKELRRATLSDGTRIPLLPSTHDPHFRSFHPSTSFPAVILVNGGRSRIGKVKVENAEQLGDVEEMIRAMGNDVEVEVEPFVDIKYDLHVQKIGKDYKSFIRRGISRHWKSNVGSSVLEQTNTSERHKEWLRTICTIVGEMHLLSIDILMSREGREFVYGVNDVLSYYGESQEEDRRAVAGLLAKLATPHGQLPRMFSREFTPGDFTPSSSTVSSPPPRAISPPSSLSQTPTKQTNGFSSNVRQPPFNPPVQPFRAGHPINGSHVQPLKMPVQIPVQTAAALAPMRKMSSSNSGPLQPPVNRGIPPEQGSLMRSERRRESEKIGNNNMSSSIEKESHSFAEDTMGQLKRTFAGIFGDVS